MLCQWCCCTKECFRNDSHIPSLGLSLAAGAALASQWGCPFCQSSVCCQSHCKATRAYASSLCASLSRTSARHLTRASDPQYVQPNGRHKHGLLLSRSWDSSRRISSAPRNPYTREWSRARLYHLRSCPCPRRPPFCHFHPKRCPHSTSLPAIGSQSSA